MTKYTSYITTFALLLFPRLAFAQGTPPTTPAAPTTPPATPPVTPSEVAEVVMICVPTPDLIPKIALFGLPLILAGVVGVMMSKSWGKKATTRSVDPAPHQTAGFAFGAWIGSLAFVALLYITSGKADETDVSTIIEKVSCLPEGWDVVAGIFFLITTILFAVTKMNAK